MSMSHIYILTMFLVPLTGFILFSGVAMLKAKDHNSEKFAANTSIFSFLGLFLFGLYQAYHIFVRGSQEVSFGNWLDVKSYFFALSFIIDYKSIAFLTCSSFLFLTVSVFSKTYLHAESGALKFYILLFLFAAGVNLVGLASNIDVLFAGWEIVGISSALLIGYFNKRVQPISNSQKVFRIYKLCDVALLTAAIWLHVFFHQTSLVQVPAHGGIYLTLISFFIVIASLGKSGQFPFCNWLRLAIEGPTPSSTIFYGSIATHMGVFLILRSSPIIEESQAVMIFIFSIGLLTSLYSTVVGRVQPDIKSSLAYSTIAQIGIIYMEIGLGFMDFALFHTILHMIYRTYQFLLSPSIIDEHNAAEMESGTPVFELGKQYSFLPSSLRKKIYHLSLNRFQLDFAGNSIIGFVAKIIDLFLQQEEAWLKKLEGKEQIDSLKDYKKVQ